MADKSPTLRTIAGISGLAVTTVSRAMADDPQIARDTREVVQKIAREIGYAPDRAAQRLRTGKTNVIALMLNPHDEVLGFGTSIIRGINTALRGTPYHLEILPQFEEHPGNDEVDRIVRNRLADGVIFSRTEPSDQRVRYLLEKGFPFISHGRTELATAHPYVDFDNFAFARKAAQSLIASGARHIGLLLPPRRFTFANHLLHGFMSVIHETGMQHEILEGITLDSPSDTIVRWMGDRLSARPPLDGLICPGEVSGLAAMAAAADCGLVPGRDIHLAVKQTSGIFDLVRPKMLSLYENLTEAGFYLGERLLRRIEGAPAESCPFLQPLPDDTAPPSFQPDRA